MWETHRVEMKGTAFIEWTVSHLLVFCGSNRLFSLSTAEEE